jgi:TrmH family RNA methyltransferase
MEKITSRHNPLVAELRRLAADKGARRASGLLLGQGWKLLYEALTAGFLPETVLCCGERPELPEKVRCYEVTEDLLAYISPMKSAPELLFACRIPEPGPVRGKHILLAEDLQDPGNVGTLIRTANAFGFDGVLLAGACADPFGPKAVRASMGAVFRRRIWSMDRDRALEALERENLPIIAAALGEDTRDAGTFAFPERLALAIGNEGHGLSRELLQASAARVRIPMEPGAESLNAGAAAAVLLWEVYRRG